MGFSSTTYDNKVLQHAKQFCDMMVFFVCFGVLGGDWREGGSFFLVIIPHCNLKMLLILILTIVD